MDEIEKLRADLVLAGWRIERNSLNDRMNNWCRSPRAFLEFTFSE